MGWILNSCRIFRILFVQEFYRSSRRKFYFAIGHVPTDEVAGRGAWGDPFWTQKSRISFNESWEIFYQKSQRLLEDYNGLVADTQVLTGTQPVSMRIGLLWGMTESVLPQILAEFKERFPSVQLEIMVGSHEEIGTEMDV